MPEFAETPKVNSNPTLKESLARRIRDAGPISFHDWMKAALYDPNCGYYCRSDLKRWGREGDYRTSPERSDLFAATFARYFAELYEKLAQPPVFNLIEFGAGEGTFARGLLSGLRDRFPSLFAKCSYLIDEVSPDARKRIKDTLADFDDRVSFVTMNKIAPLPAAIVFSNELLDAFPVHRLTLREGQIRELYVSLSETGDFIWSLGEVSSPALSDLWQEVGGPLREGQTVDLNPGIESWFDTLRLSLNAGYVVTVDYGYESTDLYDFDARPNGTLRAYSRHRFVDDILESPGDYDITTSINWTQVRDSGKRHGFMTEEFSQLDQFLLNVGILDTLKCALVQSSSEVDKVRLTTAAREMVLPGGMASSFQVLVQRRTGIGNN